MKFRYLYIFNLAIWLVVDIWQLDRFYTNIRSDRSPRLVSDLCSSILSNLFWSDLFFCSIGIILAAKILAQKQNILYFALTYVVYTGLTIFSLFGLGDSLIHYQQQQRVWDGGSPMGQFLYILAIVAIGIIVTAGYILNKIISWVMSKLRDRDR